MPFRYTPVLRTKAGEASALDRLNNAQKDRIFPLFNVAENPPTSFTPRMASAWAQRRMSLDGIYSLNFTGTPAVFNGLFHALGNSGIRIIPATEINPPANYLAAITPLIGLFSPGLVVRINIGDISAASAWIHQRGWNRSDIDLVIDAGHIAQLPANVIASLVTLECNTHVLPAHGWRSVTFVGASAPPDFGALALGVTNIPRVEWAAWNAIYPATQVSMNFGDYGPVHPNLVEPPGYVMANATVSVKYAVDGEWIAIKGRPTSGANGKPMAQQYRSHATNLTNDHRFGGVLNCWADGRIQQIAGGHLNSGNRPTWVQMALNRHIALVIDRLP